MRSFTEIPIVSIAPLLDPNATPDALGRMAARIGAACREVGFFYIENHGIQEADCRAMFTEMKRFFDLPIAEKEKLAMGKSSQFRGYVRLGGEVTQQKKDWHECLDLQPKKRDSASGDPDRSSHHPLDDPGQWPDAIPSFRLAMMRAWKQLYRLSEKLTEGLALSLGLDEGYFRPFAGDELCALRLSHYPPYERAAGQPEFEAGMGAHYDSGFVTILQQDDVGGLEVRNAAGDWISAPAIPGTFLINIGLMMQRWTNDRYRATWHRVLLPKKRSRYSMPFFFEPAYHAVIEPLAVCCDANHPPKYKPCLFGDYLSGIFSMAYEKE